MLRLMDPNNQQPLVQPGQPIPTVTPGNNPYGFIMDTANKKRGGMLPTNPASTKSRLLFVVGGGLVLLIVISIFYSLLFGGKESNTTLFKSLAAEQQEIIRVSALGVEGSSDPTIAAYAQTTKLTVQSHRTKLLSYLVANKVKVPPAQLASKKNSKVDAALSAAKASNRFDEVFKETLVAELTSYATNIQTNYKSATGDTSKKLLATEYADVSLLLK